MPFPSRALIALPALRRLEHANRHLPLMERAGQAAAESALVLLGDRGAPVAVFAGPGNNGGDALVTARVLHEHGIDVHVVAINEPAVWTGEAAVAWTSLVATGIRLHRDPPARAGLVIDGLFGIGLSRPLGPPWDALVGTLDALAIASGCPLLALDCPSGLDAATGQAFMPTVRASHTITFLGDKAGLHTADGPDYAGQVVVAPLGVETDHWLAADAPAHPEERPGKLVSREDFAACIRPRRRNSHKGSHGSVGVLGGAPSMVGAAILAARAALKIGTGRVYVGLVDEAAPRIDLVQPELMLRTPDALLAAPLTALAAGPGLGGTPDAMRLLDGILSIQTPLVLDADALNLIAAQPSRAQVLRARAHATVLTPHPAEAARLLGTDTGRVQADRIATARALAERFRAFVALKGCGTVVANPDGQWWINPTGNPALASAGTGDVLTGLLAGLLAQGWPAAQALLGAVYLHGSGGDRCLSELQLQCGLTASELIDACRTEFNQWLAETR